NALPDLVAELRRTFDLDGVGVLAHDGGGWRVVAAAGAHVPRTPDQAAFSAELDEGTVLVLAGSDLGVDDVRLLGAFVAQLRQAQEHLRLEAEAATAVELAEANSLRSALLAAVSHDLRTPLASIKAAATSLLSPEVEWDEEQAKGFAKTINAESDRLTQLVSNLLDMSRLHAGAVPITLRAVVIDVAEALPPVLVDPGLLERALANVMDNAVIWSPPDKAVRVEAAASDDHVEVRVIDQGPGVPRDQRDRLFEAFQRLGDRPGAGPHGVGLGLAVARGFMRAIGGDLGYEDTAGGGSTFVFTVPRATT